SCYVDPTRPCIWYAIYDRSFRLGREEKLLEVLPPLDWNKVGTETWGDVWAQVRQQGTGRVARGLLTRDAPRRARTWDAIFRPVRQPAWWQGDSAYHPPAYAEPLSDLERRLRAGEFVVTAEVAPPLSAATGKLERNVERVKPYVTAVNFTDNPSATARMSSLACCALALNEGAEPVLQLAARDRTRVTVQSEALGASALGVRNVLCLSGDSGRMGPEPMGRLDVVDLDSVQMLWLLRRMRDEGTYLDGRPIKTPPRLFLGAAASPYASRPEFQALREQKKVNAGAQFFQTNCIFDLDRFEVWLNALAKRDVLDKVYILAGIAPLKSARMAHYMHDKVPGVVIPERILRRMDEAGDGAEEEGVAIALELIEAVRARQAVHGVHLMAIGWEEIVPRLVTEAGLLRPGAPGAH
ncbi:MAG: methylenetetrahydrofolate reductase, partial [Chloroflexota bacterium]